MNNQRGCTVVLGGEAGQGVQYIESVLVRVAKESGFHVFADKEYMSRIRGGINTTVIRIHSERLQAHVEGIDVLVVLNRGVVSRLGGRVGTGTLIIGEESSLDGGEGVAVPFAAIALEIGRKIYANSVALGTVCGLLGIDRDRMADQVGRQLSGKDDEVVRANLLAATRGYDLGVDLRRDKGIDFGLKPAADVAEHLLLSGTEALALGALAGGCNAVFAYPMTPGTGVFTQLAQFSREVDLVVEQVEDEIGVINMALGAWYAGGRALVTTSGGGFALMTEGVSLAGMIETPVVIHLGQRPGPATGLPTRTEQGDLNLALYAGHGEFPRIILAPGTIEQCFSFARKAFNLADAFQVPVFLLTDQYLVDSIATIPDFGGNPVEIDQRVVETGEGYRRYRLTADGISPRGIPGYGSGSVCVDSDEHDEWGRITEDLDGVRVPMADKRLRKLDGLRREVLDPELTGDPDYSTLIVGWGSTCGVIREALAALAVPGLAFLFCPQVWPLPETVAGHLARARRIIAVENNQAGQFADLLQRETGAWIATRILKYNGMPFAVEELVARIGGEL
ncbi:MAG: 2-oxoacid:acceptor oxidoreductase subunit alpha [Desulfobulbaceae bacterium]|nr:MAG: 2-oxoacid:acceptor oxidoreductase subunit alpha [Desulfobulbaceae bacterium]